MTAALLWTLLLAAPLRSAKVDLAVEAVQPSVVKVFGVKGFQGIYGYMTGVIVHESGLVITRGSVTLEEAPEIQCHLHDGRRLTARIAREDRRSRMVLLRLEAPEGSRFPAAALGSSAKVAPGRFVLLVGNAYQVALGTERCAVNLGVVSAVARVPMRQGTVEFPYDRPVILHDAMNNPGCFGGPLVDLEGRVIGISGSIVENRETNAQVHYAIPIDDLRPFIDDTIARPDAPIPWTGGEEDAEAERKPGWHGIRVLRGGLNRASAAFVDSVLPGSPAEAAGLRPDDLILKADETPVESWKSLERVLGRYRAGDTVRLTVKRKEQVLLLPLTLGTEPPE